MKKEERLAKKKQKIAALANIMDINKKDKDVTNGKRKNEEDIDPENVKKVKGDPEGSVADNIVLSDDQYKQIKREIAQKTNELKSVPNFRLRFFGEKADLSLGLYY